MKFYKYIKKGKGLSESYIGDAMTFSLAASESNARMGALLAAPTAGVASRIPCYEVIEAMYKAGKEMPRTLKETALGGLAITETGKR
ncbi:hypothetical protein [Bacillus benzoevorans]|uniref:L-serine ammonia-lyase n=1 Tax=Bacillus benzoevorans TaxID=1456 RepID=A0A7X0HUS2_9BACI|nr:hypothetical protein [Bacillus benzoevorans]MBB6446045.1 L-serine deaminase [Bacillus benzoevorans]